MIADRDIARDLRHELRLHGAYFCTSAEAERLAKVIFTDQRAIHPDHVGQSPAALAETAGFAVPPKTRCLIADQTEIGWQAPLSAEKLNPVLAFYEGRDTADSIDLAERVAKFGGWGHSAVIHCDNPEIIAAYKLLIIVFNFTPWLAIQFVR